MGTRADFYVGRGAKAEWLGSIAWDGYPTGIKEFGIIDASSEADYRLAVTAMLAGRDDATLPNDGWPWPWEDSTTTDYAYAFDAGKVWAACFGRGWWPATDDRDDRGDDLPEQEFPQMDTSKAKPAGSLWPSGLATGRPRSKRSGR